MPHLRAVFSRRTHMPALMGRMLTGGARWSHCGVIAGDYVIDARMWHGVTKTPIYEWYGRYPVFEVVKIECPNPAAGEAWALAQVGKKYDYLGMIGAPWRGHSQDPARLYCSELFALTIWAAGRQMFRDMYAGLSPMDCYAVL